MTLHDRSAIHELHNWRERPLLALRGHDDRKTLGPLLTDAVEKGFGSIVVSLHAAFKFVTLRWAAALKRTSPPPSTLPTQPSVAVAVRGIGAQAF